VSGQPANQEVVLVVEDDVLIRMAIAQYPRDCGYKAIEAASADDTAALERVSAVAKAHERISSR
jgi:CheY-like chemotaxis protein